LLIVSCHHVSLYGKQRIYAAIGEIPTIYNVSISDDTPKTHQTITITCSFITAPDEAILKIGNVEEDISGGSVSFDCWKLDAGVYTAYIYAVKGSLSDTFTTSVTVTLGYEFEAYDPRKDIREAIGVLDATTGEYYIPVEDKNGDTLKVWMYLFPQEEEKQAFPLMSLELVTVTSRMTDVGGKKRTNDVVIDCNVYIPRDLDNIDCVNFMKKVASEIYTRIRNNQNDIRLTQYMEMNTVGRDLSHLEPATIMRKLFEIFCKGDYY